MIANDEESCTQHVICTQKTDNLLKKNDRNFQSLQKFI